MARTIIITGGPVHAYIDAVKLVTNRFKGGLMANLAEQLATMGEHVVYLSAKDAAAPKEGIELVTHDGFQDYREKVKQLAKTADAVILGAAVANLIPDTLQLPDGTSKSLPLKEKFPSHLFKPGDPIPMTWKVAPRVIDEVKGEMKPGAHLFGFKLLSGVSHEELVSAAYGVLLESGSTAVFANDAQDLDKVYAVTKERGEHQLRRLSDDVTEFISDLLDDAYYRTTMVNELPPSEEVSQGQDKLRELIDKYRDKFVVMDNGMVFGTVATRLFGGGFITTGRGKKELEDFSLVRSVDHEERVVFTYGRKATLNAPLLEHMFAIHLKAESIVHYHQQEEGLQVLGYAPPGTERDSLRLIYGSFNVSGHGAFLLLDKDGVQL